MSIFEEIEISIQQAFKNKFTNEYEVTNKLLLVYEAFVKATSGQIKDNDYPKWTILMLLSQTLPLMCNALEMLSKGYLRSSEIFIRVAAESMILAAYFTEFPEAEVEFRRINYRDFYHKHKVEDMLKKVEKDGKLLLNDKKKAKEIKWNKVVFENLYKESSKFLHNNTDLIYDLIQDQINPGDNARLIIGPQLYSDKTLALGLRRILNSTLFSLVVMGVSLNIYPDESEKKIMDDSQKIVEELNI